MVQRRDDAWRLTVALCRLLSPAVSAAHGRATLEQVAGPDLVALAAQHRSLPALYAGLVRKGLFAQLDAISQEVLEAGFEFNRARSVRLRARALGIARILNDTEISYALLKGSAQLVNAGDQLGSRVLGDIDVLVPADRIEVAAAALCASGYTPRDPPGLRDHSWTALWHEDGRSVVDLHHQLGPQRDVLAGEAALQAVETVVCGDDHVRVLNSTHRVVHAVFHAQLQDRHHVRGVIGVRAMQDVAELHHAQGAAIDWREAETRMARAGYRAAFRAFMATTRELFGTETPVAVDRRSRLHLRRLALETRSARVRGLAEGVSALTHLLHRPALKYHYPQSPRAIAALKVSMRAVRRHGWNAPAKIRYLLARYRSYHSS